MLLALLNQIIGITSLYTEQERAPPVCACASVPGEAAWRLHRTHTSTHTQTGEVVYGLV